MRTLVRDSGGIEKHRSDGGSAELHIARNSLAKQHFGCTVVDPEEDQLEPAGAAD